MFLRTPISPCRVVSGWNVTLNGAKQENLIITAVTEPKITVDNMEVRQFIYYFCITRRYAT